MIPKDLTSSFEKAVFKKFAQHVTKSTVVFDMVPKAYDEVAHHNI